MYNKDVYIKMVVTASELCMDLSHIRIRCGNFGDSATNKRNIAYFVLCMRETAIFPLPV